MALIDTTKITLPKEVAQGIISKSRDTSVIQTLSPSTPMMFKDMSHILFTKEPEAEFVGEGKEKGNANAEFKPVPGTIHKAQVTVRLTDEVKWADEDSQLGIIDALIDASAAAVGRALDYGILHAINPATGSVVDGMTALVAGANVVNATTDASADLDTLVEKVNENFEVSGIALSKAFANSLRKIRIKNTGLRMYPEIPLNLKAGVIDGITAATSSTVNGKLATAPTNVLAVLGDFSLIKWGIVRDLGLEIIETGDPDGLGDLKRLNQIAYRTEVVYSWAVLDPKGFAALKSA
ncbi:phage major capsid protein [uncultured Olegusella sp.]|uniref:phage major capsid protein n=1 Tax=uncultured Olegusella sp. TaxID=1979846 RepID=UPI002606D0AA|nr:phage major capsid protein [uncultured Olegusella sp.]